MKFIAKIFSVLLLFYALVWLGAALYFSYAEHHKDLLEANLSSIFKRQVTIQQVHTAWNGLAPLIQLNGFTVAGDTDQPALAFKSLSAEIEPLSILRLWPQLSEFAVERPSLEIVSLPNNKLQVAGFTLGSNRSIGLNPKRLISWLVNHKNAVWFDGEIIWRRKNGEQHHYKDISFVYQRNGKKRQISATSQTPNGLFAFKAQSQGDMMGAEPWDAALEVLGKEGKRLLAADDLSLSVKDGQGKLTLKTLNIQSVKDFLLLTGLGNSARWLFDSQLSGRLHDAEFRFSGPLLEFSDWGLSAQASELGFSAIGAAPGMTKLAGKIVVLPAQGSFEFSVNDARFEWPHWFDQSFPIQQAAGRFNWTIAKNGEIEIKMTDVVLEDGVSKIWDVNASCIVDSKNRNISNFAQLFEVESVADLRFEDGELVQRTGTASEDAVRENPLRALHLRADAKFEIKSLAKTLQYLPNDPRLEKLREWWENAFLGGVASNGTLSYRGEVSKTALQQGRAQIRGQVEFSDVALNYGYQRDWPKLRNSRGYAKLNNGLLTIIPSHGWLEEDPIFETEVTISSLFERDRQLDVRGSIVTSLPRVTQLLFNGPLIKPDQRGQTLPIVAQSGRVSANLKVSIPLRKVRDVKVQGTAKIDGGHLLLPEGVPITDLSAEIDFTERSVESGDIKANFLGGEATAKLFTTAEVQPPKMKITATGLANIERLEPWIGKHILAWLKGTTSWQGEVVVDGPKIGIAATSQLVGVSATAPGPLAKTRQQERGFSLDMMVGSKRVRQRMSLQYGDQLHARFSGNLKQGNRLLDNSLIYFGSKGETASLIVKPGVNFLIDQAQLDLDSWLTAIIDLAQLETEPVEPANTAFLDAMRSVKIISSAPQFLGRSFGALKVAAVSQDGNHWTAGVTGDNVAGTLNAEPRAGNYQFNLSRLHLVEPAKSALLPPPIDRSLQPTKYPKLELIVDALKISDKPLGRLHLVGKPVDQAWTLSKFELTGQGIHTTGRGSWVNHNGPGSYSSFATDTTIDAAGDVLDEMEFSGIVKKGRGQLTGNFNWLGAPHEFDFTRLNGDFDLRIRDGELVKVTPGSGKLLGLFNFNAIFRRLTLDFRDVFSGGLQFDRMRYAGLLANGEAIMRDAYIFTPAVYVAMEGKIDLSKELIDMEIHASPELGGNITLLSALANPTAGALVFLTQQIFKDQMRSSNLRSYRALGTWDDFEIVEFNTDEPIPGVIPKSPSPPSDSPHSRPVNIGTQQLDSRQFDAGQKNITSERAPIEASQLLDIPRDQSIGGAATVSYHIGA